MATGLKTQCDITQILSDYTINIEVTSHAGASCDQSSVTNMMDVTDEGATDITGLMKQRMRLSLDSIRVSSIT